MALAHIKLCGARKRDGGSCGMPAMANGKCRIHGGKSTGPKNPKANPGSTKYGVYAQLVKPEELDLDFQIGNVDAELDLARLTLFRIVQAEAKWEADVAKGEDISETGLDLVEVVREEGDRVVGEQIMPISSIRKVRRRPDFEAQRNRWMARIESLEKTRKELVGDGGDQDLRDKAAKLRTFIDEMDGSVPEIIEDSSNSTEN